MDMNIPFPNYVASEKVNLNLPELVDYSYRAKSASEGRVLSNVGGWQSKNLNKDDQELKDVIAAIRSAIYKIKTVFGMDENLVVGNMWININGNADFNKPHVHPLSMLSGVIYIKTPHDCGDLIFCNPNRDVVYYEPYFKNFKLHTYQTYPYAAKENLLYIFPSWQEHYAAPNRSSEDRISIAFNVVPPK